MKKRVFQHPFEKNTFKEWVWDNGSGRPDHPAPININGDGWWKPLPLWVEFGDAPHYIKAQEELEEFFTFHTILV